MLFILRIFQALKNIRWAHSSLLSWFPIYFLILRVEHWILKEYMSASNLLKNHMISSYIGYHQLFSLNFKLGNQELLSWTAWKRVIFTEFLNEKQIYFLSVHEGNVLQALSREIYRLISLFYSSFSFPNTYISVSVNSSETNFNKATSVWFSLASV